MDSNGSRLLCDSLFINLWNNFSEGHSRSDYLWNSLNIDRDFMAEPLFNLEEEGSICKKD